MTSSALAAIPSASAEHDVTDRILVIVPHEPDADPRVKWVATLCAELCRTDIVGYTYTIEKPFCEYDGKVYTERVTHHHYPFIAAKLLRKGIHLLSFSFRLAQHPIRTLRGSTVVRNFKLKGLAFLGMKVQNASESLTPHTVQRDYGRPPYGHELKRGTPIQNVMAAIQDRAIAMRHFLGSLEAYNLIVGTLYRRLRGTSIIPRLMICHDIYALGAAVKLKKLYGCPLLYDSHEYWPEADLEAADWEKRMTARLEKRLVRHADVVITVTPQIARQMEKVYGITGVVSVPNAEPLKENVIPSWQRPPSLPLKFLLQGGAAPGRGIDELLSLWTHVQDSRAILIVRCPRNDYLDYLRSKFRMEIESGHIVMADAVTEDALVEAASAADVGVIPYGGPNLNHLYACPNKLSQYMHAGLAILANADMQFVTQMTTEFECGQAYESSDPETLIRAVNVWLDNTDQLQMMKVRAYRTGQRVLNWEVQSTAYRDAIRHLFSSQRGTA